MSDQGSGDEAGRDVGDLAEEDAAIDAVFDVGEQAGAPDAEAEADSGE